ncbi:MAG: hypothetical protein LBH24_06815 [Clostridiales bacterium]|jgi:hypothetical protein|nr:hypothetical protein [Clostridiales bacterium]
MKRRILTTALCCFIAAGYLAGCRTKTEKYDAVISEIRGLVMTAESDALSVELISGEREEPFSFDGVSAARIAFTVVTITPKKKGHTGEYRYELYIGAEKYEGAFKRHAFRESYSFEAAVKTPNAAALTVTEAQGYVENFELVSMRKEGMIGAETALELALIRLKNNVSAATAGGKLNAEIYIRFVKNSVTSDGGYYWYVAFMPPDGALFAVMIDPYSKEIVAVRE